jgi:hypothetical protein
MASTSVGSSVSIVVEHGQLAEDVARPEVGERERAPIGMRAHRPGPARAHDIARVALVALTEHDLVGGEMAGHGDVRHACQILLAQRREDRDASQELPRLRADRVHWLEG